MSVRKRIIPYIILAVLLTLSCAAHAAPAHKPKPQPVRPVIQSFRKTPAFQKNHYVLRPAPACRYRPPVPYPAAWDRRYYNRYYPRPYYGPYRRPYYGYYGHHSLHSRDYAYLATGVFLSALLAGY